MRRRGIKCDLDRRSGHNAAAVGGYAVRCSNPRPEERWPETFRLLPERLLPFDPDRCVGIVDRTGDADRADARVITGWRATGC